MIFRRIKAHTEKALLVATTALFGTACAPQPVASEKAENSESASVAEVIAARDAFNKAIAEGDIEGISSALNENVILVTGTDSDIYLGRDAQTSLWQSDLDQASRLVCKRTPNSVNSSELYQIAHEIGSWRCHALNDQTNDVTRHYAAKWRRTDGTWRLEAETYTTLQCTGTFCPNNRLDSE